MDRKTILMVEDNTEILHNNREALEDEGYRVLAAETLAAARAVMEKESPDLILLDILLPDGNGLEACREVFGQNGPPILFLSALNKKRDVLAGLRQGDGYLTKPCRIDDLLAQVEYLLEQDAPAPLGTGGLELNPTAGRACLDGRDLLLTPREYLLLELLLQNRGRYLPSKELYERVWGMEALDMRPVKQHIRNLRDKLGDAAPVVIESRQGQGYRLTER